MAPNAFLLAADNPAELVTLLRSSPELASAQDDHGYSLLHAATSYNHLDLLRRLVQEFNVDINLKDEDGETALFVAETVECVKILVEELGADITIRGEEGKTARESIEEDGDFAEVAVYLRIKELESLGNGTNGTSAAVSHPPAVPDGLSIDIGTMVPEEELGEVADPDLRRRIEELAARPDFQEAGGQEALMQLIREAISGDLPSERDVRQRTS